MELLIHLIQKSSVSRATKAVKNMTEGLYKRNKLMKTAGKSPAGWNKVREYLSENLESDRAIKS